MIFNIRSVALARAHFRVMFLLAITLLTVSPCLIQADDLDIYFEDGLLVYLNSEYFNKNATYMEVNDESTYGSCVSFSIDLIKGLPEEAQMIFTVMQYRYGDYTLETGIRSEQNLCGVVRARKKLLMPLLNLVGITEDNCPIQPGVYSLSCYYPKFPPGVSSVAPHGKFKASSTMMIGETKLLEMVLYLNN